MKLKIVETNSAISAQVFPGVRYGFILAAGTNKKFDVQGYVRRSSAGDRGQFVATRNLKSRTNVKFKKTAEGVEFVGAYKRKVHLDPRPFLPNALDSVEPEIQPEIEAAVERGMA